MTRTCATSERAGERARCLASVRLGAALLENSLTGELLFADSLVLEPKLRASKIMPAACFPSAK